MRKMVGFPRYKVYEIQRKPIMLLSVWKDRVLPEDGILWTGEK